MNDLKVFSNSEFGELGVMVIDGKEWFPATQCASILGYSNPRDAIKRHCKSDGVVKHDGVSYTTNQHGITSQQTVEIKYINEGNLYRLIVHSKLPKAVEFEKWIFDTVLPSIRHNGGYIANAEELIARTATAVVSEVMKQLVPLISQIAQPQPQSIIMQPLQPQAIVVQPVQPQPVTEYTLPRKYEYKPTARYCSGSRPRRIPSVIDQLGDELKAQVHEMMASGLYSSEKISEFLKKHNIKLSQVSICKYKRNHFKIIK